MDRKRIPDLWIEQYLLGELPEERIAEIEQSDDFEERITALRASNEQILTDYPTDVFAKRIANRAAADQARSTEAPKERERSASLRWIRFALPGVAAAALAIVLFTQGIIGGGGQIPGQGPDVVRLKGRPEISIFRSVASAGARNTGSEELSDGALALPGDELQIEYNAGDKPYGMIVSVDGRNVATLHFPLVPSDGPSLVAGSTQRLPVAYVLDDAPDYEKFYFITSAEQFSVRSVFQSIQNAAAQFVRNPDSVLDASGHYEVITFTVRKGE